MVKHQVDPFVLVELFASKSSLQRSNGSTSIGLDGA